jgi:hypothetical protein
MNRGILVSNILIVFLFLSCTSKTQKRNFEIYGFTLGDTLTNEFKVIKEQDYPFSRAELIRDRRVEVSLIDKYITAITFDNLAKKEYVDLKKIISVQTKLEPNYYEGVTPYNVKIKGDVFYWHDTITGVEVLLSRNFQADTSFNHLSVYNQKLSDSLLKKFIPVADTSHYEIMYGE